MNMKQFDSLMKECYGKDVYVGFSGGADSTMVLLIADYFKNIYNYKVKAVHFEHGLRGNEALDDADHCIDFCNKRNIDIEVIHLNLKNCSQIENVARQTRLDWWNKNCDENSIVMLGHHLDDQIENFFIRMSRGSNITGLIGIRKISKMNEFTIIRPLLETSKKDIEKFLEKENINWVIDGTNNDCICQRNYLRNKLLPEWYKQHGFIYGGIKQSLNTISEDADFIENEVENKFKEIENVNGISIDFWKRLHNAIRVRLLRKWVNTCIVEYVPSKSLVEQFNRMCESFDNTDHKHLKINNDYEFLFKANKTYIQRFVNENSN